MKREIVQYLSELITQNVIDATEVSIFIPFKFYNMIILLYTGYVILCAYYYQCIGMRPQRYYAVHAAFNDQCCVLQATQWSNSKILRVIIEYTLDIHTSYIIQNTCTIIQIYYIKYRCRYII